MYINGVETIGENIEEVWIGGGGEPGEEDSIGDSRVAIFSERYRLGVGEGDNFGGGVAPG